MSTIMKTQTSPTRFVDRSFEVSDHPLRFSVVNVSPPLAEQALAKTHPRQRPEKPAKIGRFAADMEAGRWRLTHQAVAFDEDGFLVDGRNRMKAVLKSRSCVQMVFCHGVPRQSAVVVDTGTSRNVNDAACFAGVSLDNRGAGAVARRMAAGLAGKDELTVQQVLDQIASYADGLRFAFGAFGKGNTKGVLVASTRAVMARAYYTSSRGRLQQFGEYLVSGLPDEPKRDAAVILLRNWLLEAATPGKRRSQGGRADRRLTYSMTEFALEQFLAGKRPAQLLEVSEEKFPLPDLSTFDAE